MLRISTCFMLLILVKAGSLLAEARTSCVPPIILPNCITDMCPEAPRPCDVRNTCWPDFCDKCERPLRAHCNCLPRPCELLGSCRAPQHFMLSGRRPCAPEPKFPEIRDLTGHLVFDSNLLINDRKEVYLEAE